MSLTHVCLITLNHLDPIVEKKEGILHDVDFHDVYKIAKVSLTVC